MDCLKDKNYKSYQYISRYTNFPYYYNTLDNKYVYGITSQLNKDVEYVLHKITQRDTLDSLSWKYYGRPDLYWIIADFNSIQDPFKELFNNYITLKIPSLGNIAYKK